MTREEQEHMEYNAFRQGFSDAMRDYQQGYSDAMRDFRQEPCEDAISRQAVLEYIEGSEAELGHSSENELVCQHIKEFPSITPTWRWILVSERLPENSGRYLAYIVNKHNDKLRYIMTCEYLLDGYWNWFPDDECASDNVIAWMPLPVEPYEAESEE